MKRTAPRTPARAATRLMLAGAVLLLALGSAVGADQLFWRGAHAAAVGSALRSAILAPGAIFAARSPGARASGLLLQTKPGPVARAHIMPPLAAPPEGPPEERVLAGVHELPGAGAPDLPGVGPAAPPLIPADLGPPFASTGSTPGSIPEDSEFPPSFPPGIGGGLPPGGSTPFTVTPPIAAPEPAEWMLMILSVFCVGAALRRRRSRDRQPSVAAARPHA